MRLNHNEIDKELEESIADGTTLKGSRSGTKTRVRTPGFGHGRRDVAQRRRDSHRLRQATTEEGSL